jgi:hypothetical protein
MRRGLISRSKVELPDVVFDARLARLRAAMDTARLDALLVYTNNTRPAGVSWLTGFVPYWSEALLVVPRDRPPVLVVALTYRVKTWIERTSRVADVVHTPRIGLEAARMIAGWRSDAAVGIVDLDGLSAGILDDLREAGPRLALGDATALFARLRAKADPAEIALATKAASIALAAFAAGANRDSGLGDIIADVEARARQMGAEEVYMAAVPDLAGDRRWRRIEGEAECGDRFALRATVAYKGTWVRFARSFHRSGGDAAAQAAADRFAAAVAELPDDRALAGFSSWLVEGCRTAQPLDPLIGSQITERRSPEPGSLVSVQAAIDLEGEVVLLGAPVLIGGVGEAASLLVQPI